MEKERAMLHLQVIQVAVIRAMASQTQSQELSNILKFNADNTHSNICNAKCKAGKGNRPVPYLFFHMFKPS